MLAAELLHSWRDGRSLGAALVVNFVVVPLAAAMFRLLSAEQAMTAVASSIPRRKLVLRTSMDVPQ